MSNPENDPIDALFFTVNNEKAKQKHEQRSNIPFKSITGMIIVDPINYEILQNEQINLRVFYRIPTSVNDIIVVKDELSLIYTYILMIFKIDPDIIGGYDMEQRSLYYLARRAWVYEIDILGNIGRSPPDLDGIFDFAMFNDFFSSEDQYSVLTKSNLASNQGQDSNYFGYQDAQFRFGVQKESPLDQSIQEQMDRLRRISKLPSKKAFKLQYKISGRVILCSWRYAKSDLKLTNYDVENVVYHLFKVREPVYDNWTLTQFFNNIDQRHIVLQYFIKRAEYSEKIIKKLGTITMGCESTKLYGCDFESMILRGSQFRIETVLMCTTKKLNYILLSASRIQVAHQRPLQCLPLIMEPPKIYYQDPLVVLDFQSLYPSIMISHNICFTTCLRCYDDVFQQGGYKRIGVKKDVGIDLSSLFKGKSEEEIKSMVFIAPNKMVYLRKHIKKGVLPTLLEELLNTRIMVKQSMKYYQDDEYLQKVYGYRQSNMKLFMNVMFGYSAASHTGRMPCGDIADSIVGVGHTIVKSISQDINNHKEWKANVVYGDTDSVFVYLRGRSKEKSFEIGKEISKEITKKFPNPMKLVFEKIYMPSILVSKKRYVAHKYETPDSTPVFESKGIEIVRRDGCDAMVKIMTKCLQELFVNKNLSNIKNYLQQQYAKIVNGHINLKDFMIAKEVKLGKYIQEIPPAHAYVAQRLEKKDPMLRPKYGERIKFIIQKGSERDKVRDMALSCQEFLTAENSVINHNHYIKRMINSSLHRLFSTFDIDVSDWYESMPKNITKYNLVRNTQQKIQNMKKSNKGNTIVNFSLSKFFQTKICILCFNKSDVQICLNCLQDDKICLQMLQKRIQLLKQNLQDQEQICKNCANLNYYNIEEVPCKAENCDTYYDKHYTREQYKAIVPQLQKYVDILENEL